MSTRWTFREDLFLFDHFEAVGDFIGAHDLARPDGAATRRVARLKATGAWDCLRRYRLAESDYRRCLNLPSIEDDEEVAA